MQTGIMMTALMLTLALSSQTPAMSAASSPSSHLSSYSYADGDVRGQVKDASDGSTVAFADVIITDIQDKVVAHTTTGEDGSFSIAGIKAGKYIVTVKMMGYAAWVSDPVDSSEGLKDLGTISLNPSGEGIQEVTVVGEKSQIVYKLDRQTISASSNAIAAGGTVVDILAGTPSVLVDSDGNVTFRGSGNFLVYVDGRLSPLEGSAALRQIPSSNVEDIEIITTPSARYRTDGDGPIINITTRKNSASGLSGIISLTGSTIGTHGADGTLNWRKGRNNFYLGGTYQHVKGRSDFHQEKITDILGVETTSISDGQRFSDMATRIARAGWQYSDGKKNNLQLEVQYGSTDNGRGGDMLYDETRVSTDANTHAVYNAHDRYNNHKNLFQFSLDYVWRPTPKSEIALSNRVRHDWDCLEYTESNLFDQSGVRYEGTRGYESEHHWDADGSLTYKYNFSENGNFEAGYQYTTYSEHGGYKIKYWNREIQDFEWQDDITTPFYYRRQVNSVYGMLTQKAGRFNFDAGLRADRVLDELEIDVVGADRDIRRFNIFPSAHVSYDGHNAGTVTLGYSYRTNRPGIWNLEPYITYEDYYTKKLGNPDINPEYIHSGELGWHKTFESGNSLAATGYFRYRNDISEWVRSAYEPGVTLDQIVNSGDQIETGLEANAIFKPVKWWQTTVGSCLFDYKFTAENEVCTDREGLHWFANWANAFSIKKATKIQFDAHVIGPKILSQGSEKAYFYFDAAISQDLLKNRMTIALVGHNIFRTAKFNNELVAPGLSSHTTVMPVYPNLVLSLTYNFNSSSHKSHSSTDTELFEGRNF